MSNEQPTVDSLVTGLVDSLVVIYGMLYRLQFGLSPAIAASLKELETDPGFQWLHSLLAPPHIEFTPEMAAEVSQKLIEAAKQAPRNNPLIVTSELPGMEQALQMYCANCGSTAMQFKPLAVKESPDQKPGYILASDGWSTAGGDILSDESNEGDQADE